MITVDCHLYSRHSPRMFIWPGTLNGRSVCGPEPGTQYQSALQCGMHFVTLTDRHSLAGSLLLKKLYPQRCFTGVEVETFFPEDGKRILLLIFGLDEQQFAQILNLRRNIYSLRDYLKVQRLAHSVAYSADIFFRQLLISHIEKLFLLFDVFETRNSAADHASLRLWEKILSSVTPRQIDACYAKYQIEPISADPWRKAFTGGSADCSGRFVARSATLVGHAGSPEEFLAKFQAKQTLASGRSNAFHSLVFDSYESMAEASSWPRLFPGPKPNLSEKARGPMPLFWFWHILSRFHPSPNLRARFALLAETCANKNLPLEIRYERLYLKLSDFIDLRIKTLFRDALVRNSASPIAAWSTLRKAFSGMLLALPFLSSIAHQGAQFRHARKLAAHFNISPPHDRRQRILVFTDFWENRQLDSGATDFPEAYEHCCAIAAPLLPAVPNPRFLPLPIVSAFPLPGHEQRMLRFPSILRGLKLIHDFQPSLIRVVSPGPIGALGLLAAKLWHIPAAFCLEKDFSHAVRMHDPSSSLVDAWEMYFQWFLNQADEIRVPGKVYADLLVQQGFDASKVIFDQPRLDTRHFSPKTENREGLWSKTGDEFVLLYVGWIGRENNLDLLLQVYADLVTRLPNLILFIAGEGSYRKAFQARCEPHEKIIFLGNPGHEDLPKWYSCADALVFPCTHEPFGREVAEAQACGCPVLVSDQGNPQTLVLPERSGKILSAHRPEAWELAIIKWYTLKTLQPQAYLQLRANARAHALQIFGGHSEKPMREYGKKKWESPAAVNHIPGRPHTLKESPNALL